MIKTYWKAEEFTYRKHKADWYWVFWSLILLMAFLSYYFLNDFIFSGLIITSAIIINIAHFKKPRIIKYGLDDQNIYMDDERTVIPFSEVDSYNIDLLNMKILIKKKKDFRLLIQIPFENTQNISKVDKFLSTKIKKDSNLEIPISELFVNKILGF